MVLGDERPCIPQSPSLARAGLYDICYLVGGWAWLSLLDVSDKMKSGQSSGLESRTPGILSAGASFGCMSLGKVFSLLWAVVHPAAPAVQDERRVPLETPRTNTCVW